MISLHIRREKALQPDDILCVIRFAFAEVGDVGDLGNLQEPANPLRGIGLESGGFFLSFSKFQRPSRL